MDDEELWKEWPEDPRIMVSNKGNVVSYKRGAPYPLKVGHSGSGYQMVGADRQSQFVHKMVADTWLENPNHLTEVNHIDGDKNNNSAENLEWTTHSENMRHAYRTGLNKSAKPIRIVETGETFESLAECARQIGCTQQNISNCLAGRQLTCRGYHFEYV